MEYEVELPDEPIEGLFRGRVYARAERTGEPSFLLAAFTATTWRHVQEEVRAIRAAHRQSSTYVFDDDDELVRK